MNPRFDLPLDRLDRLVVFYLALPLFIFVLGWFEWWAALPLAASLAWPLWRMVSVRATAAAPRLSTAQLYTAIVVGIVWSGLGGTGHFVYANHDWVVRDAVLHDLVATAWPTGYGTAEGHQTLLRAPLAFYLPAALLGKSLGLGAAHLGMAAWTGFGTCLFLMQVLSLLPSTPRAIATGVLVVVFFSGFDLIGNIITESRFFADWRITNHLEWWAGSYQYSSMTTQLFWVPNHAFGGWLTVGLLCRYSDDERLDRILPLVLVADLFWSPLSTMGLLPFVAWRFVDHGSWQRARQMLRLGVWLPVAPVALALCAYYHLDTAKLPATLALGNDVVMGVLRQVQFFLLEAGLIGFAVLWMIRSRQIVLALVLLAVLPIINFGPGNDLVMRASIPSLALLAIGVAAALCASSPNEIYSRKKALLAGMMLIGSVTAIHEIARAILVPRWPIDLQSSLISAANGAYPPHYVARLQNQPIAKLFKPVQDVAVVPRAGIMSGAQRQIAHAD